MVLLPLLALAAWEQVVDGLSAVPLAVVLALSLAGVVVYSLRSEQLKSIRRILETYAWQVAPADRSKRHEAAVKHGFHHFKVSNPDNPGKSVEIVAQRSRAMGKKWKRALAAARDEGFLFAGDPRFGGVMAPRGRLEDLVLVRPRRPFLNIDDRPDEVSGRAWQLAVAARVSGTWHGLATPEQVEELQELVRQERKEGR
ncbi:hypothetical protein [Streptomyces sioyaensis]|uniref:hypothetical protein n=1 Tax=Streptomyces sioyaensis TaxID=67364 RepID=UPI0037B11EE2